MNRRMLLRHLATLPLLPRLWSSPAPVRSAVPSKRLARVRPSDPSWPSPAGWETLKQQVGGQLLPIQFPLAACANSLDDASCQDLLKNLGNPYYIGEHPGLTQTLGWVNAWVTRPSIYAVAARNAEDIAAAVNFARDHRLRLVVKGGGHSYLGTSNAPDSLLIWTRRMHDITMHSEFVPQGCAGVHKPQPAVTVGAGAIWIQAYDAVTTKGGRYVQGGGCTTVGVAGLIQSGGFGSFSKHYGLAAAGLLQAEVVTADGQIRIANACQNPDLFWALKGGGGSTFGVVSKLTLREHELPEFFGAVVITVRASSDAAYRQLVHKFVSFYRDQLFNHHWGEQAHISPDNSLEIRMVFQGLNREQAAQLWQPFLDWIARSPQDYSHKDPPFFVSIPARNLWDVDYMKQHLPQVFTSDTRPGAPAGNVWWEGDGGQVGQMLHGYESQWLAASLLENDSQERLANALFVSSRHWEVELHFNKGLAGAPADAIAAARDTATNPAVLDAFALAIIAGGEQHAYPGIRGHEPNAAAAQKRAAAIRQAMEELRKVSPRPGSYVSESNFFESSWQESYWGTNYPRLQAVKAKYDPDGLFFVHHGAGSEGWSDDGFTPLPPR